ncbi:MAG: hypothetical protein HW403_1317 [Dehalococcoidia bacterium]|nr:hypothetical protein [Dehalococcoidia bacterium]
MTDFMGLNATRRNHALEHATITVLLERMGFRRRLAGRSNASGFYILGNLPTEAVEKAVSDALTRLQRGEADLAVSPFCGTNLAVSGILAGLCTLGMTQGRGGLAQRASNAMLGGILAVIVGQPLGALAQKYITTSPNLAGVKVRKVAATGWGPFTVHKVDITQA